MKLTRRLLFSSSHFLRHSVQLCSGSRGLITAGVAIQRFAQGIGLLDVFTQIWIENPTLAKQAGRKAEEFMVPLEEVQRRHASDLFFLEKL